jgi:hypothetical protein
MRGLSILAALCLVGLPAQAQIRATCTFTTECAEGDACEATDFAVDLDTTGADGAATLTSEAQTVEGVLSVTPAGATYFFAVEEHGLHLLTIAGHDAPVHYTVHITDPGLVLTYIGACEDRP